MEAGGVCLQKRRRRRKRDETPAETVSKGWGGPSPPPGHGERPAGRDVMCCGAGGGAGGVNHGAGSRPAGREEPSSAEPSPASCYGCPAPRGGIAPFLVPASPMGLRAVLSRTRCSATAGTRSPSRHSRRGAGHVGLHCGSRYRRPPRRSGMRLPSPGPPNLQNTRRHSNISLAVKSGENGKPPAGRSASPLSARRESQLRRQHLHGPPGPGAVLPPPLRRATLVPLPAPAKVRRYSPPGTGPSERSRTLPPHRRGARQSARPAGPVPSPVPVPVPVPPSGWLHRDSGRNAPTGRAEPWGAPVATAAIGVA